MPDPIETAQPAAEVAGGQTAPETTTAAPATEAVAAPAQPAAAEPAALTLDEILSKRFDELQAPPKEEKPSEAAPAEPDTAQTAASEPAQSSPAIAPPQSVSADVKELWPSLPPKAQEFIARREQEATAKISAQGNELKAFQPLRETVSQLHQWGLAPGKEAEAIRNWAVAQMALDNPTTRIDALKSIAQSYGVDLAQIAGQPKATDPAAQSVDDLFRDPRVDQLIPALQQEIQTLKQQLGHVGGQVTARERAETQHRERSAADVVQKFSADKAHWSELEDEITHEVNFIRSKEPGLAIEKVLERAYDRAVYANPQIRERVLGEQRKAEADKAAKELATKQAAAKKAASMNVRTGAAASTPTFDGKWNDNLGAIYDKITSGA